MEALNQLSNERAGDHWVEGKCPADATQQRLLHLCRVHLGRLCLANPADSVCMLKHFTLPTKVHQFRVESRQLLMLPMSWCEAFWIVGIQVS